MNISGTTGSTFRACYKLNPDTKKVESSTYNFTDLLQKIHNYAAAAKEEFPQIGHQELSEGDLTQLAGQFDPKHMSQVEYDRFLTFLQEKGVLSRMETSDLGMSRRVLNSGHFEPLYLSDSLFGEEALVHTLDDVNGDALQFSQIMSQWQAPGEQQIRKTAYCKILEILTNMERMREIV